MLTYPCTVPVADLLADIQRVPVERMPVGAGTARGEGTRDGWITAFSNARINVLEYPAILRSIENLQRQTLRRGLNQVMVNVLHAGGNLAPHRDGPPKHYRYHLPVVTDDLVTWWDEIEGKRHMLARWWYGPVPYCGMLHSMWNPSKIDRIHIVADFSE